jgi:hypothetical protein
MSSEHLILQSVVASVAIGYTGSTKRQRAKQFEKRQLQSLLKRLTERTM